MNVPTRLACLALGHVLASGDFAAAQTTPGGNPTLAGTPVWLGNPGVDEAKARAHLREQRAARLRWEQATTTGEYDRVGKQDPRWDADQTLCLDPRRRTGFPIRRG